MGTHITKRGNLCEILYTNAELRLFTGDKEHRLFQCSLSVDGTHAHVTLGATFDTSGVGVFFDVEQGLLAEGFSSVSFEREKGGEVKHHTLKQRD